MKKYIFGSVFVLMLVLGFSVNKVGAAGIRSYSDSQKTIANGIQVNYVSSSAASTTNQGSNNDEGTFEFNLNVTALGHDAYISSDGLTSLLYTVDKAGVSITNGINVSIVDLSPVATINNTGPGFYKVQAGTTHLFKVTVKVTLPTAGNAGLYRVVLSGLRWGTNSMNPLPANTYSMNVASPYLSLN